MCGHISTALVLTLAMSAVLFACGNFKDRVEGSGNVVAQHMSFSGFDKVEVGSAFDVTISPGATFTFKVEADDNLLEYLDIKKSADTLIIIGLKMARR